LEPGFEGLGDLTEAKQQMSLDSISRLASACHERAYLTRWFPANIKTGEDPYSFGDTEMAIVEDTLRTIERGHSLLIHDPIPSNRTVLGICLAYARTQDPRFPEEGIVGGGQSLLAFPALHHGYVSELDSLKEDGIGQNPALVDREPIGKLSETQGRADIYTAKNNFEFDQDRPADNVGAVLVDLRKPEWGNVSRRFDEIMALYESSNCPFIFYTDETTPATESIPDHMHTIEVTNELLTTAEPASLPDNPSLTTRFEHLINTEEIGVEHITVGYPELYQIVSDLSAMRDDLQSSHSIQGVIKMEVGWLFNLLTRLPVKPEYWDGVVAENYYQHGIRELLENLRGKAQRLGGREADVLINYCEAADALHGRLNTEHPIQETLFELISTTSGADTPRTVVVKNDFERKAILQALTFEDAELAENVSIRTEEEVEPSTDTEVIVARPLDSDSYLYDFPASNQIAFLQFEPWAPIVEDRLERGLGKIGVSIETSEVGQVGGRTEPDVPDQPEPQQPAQTYDRPADTQDPTESLRDDFENGEASSTSGGSSSGGATSRDPDIEVALSNGDTREFSELARVRVLKDNGDIARKVAGDLSVGETILLLDSATEDIYDLFVESAHQKEKLRKAESVVERWRSALDEGLSSTTEEAFLAEMQDAGSKIVHHSTLSNWRNGHAIGPQDPDDVGRVFDIVEPDMKPTDELTVNAMKRIRSEHRRIGKEARKAIESQMDGGVATELSTDLPADVSQSSQDVRKETIDSISPIDK